MNQYSKEEQKILLELASNTIAFGLKNHARMPVNIEAYSEKLKENLACFVTLKIHGQLRGCIGSLKAYQPLVKDVVHNAYAAAFSDPRFSPLTQLEFADIEIDISILSSPEPIEFKSEEDLLRQLRPGVDGLILTEGSHRGTFLPSVWESLKTPQQFLAHLKRKAGLSENYWSETLSIERYVAELIH